jgi:multiple sugar transport system permease protein
MTASGPKSKKPGRRVGRILVYAALVAASVVFMTPLLWLVLTALKPIEQTMSRPLTFLPRTHLVTIDGEALDVTQDYQAPLPGAVVDVQDGDLAGRRVFLDHNQLAVRRDQVEIVYEVPAGWWHVTERLDPNEPPRLQRWAFVAPEEIQTFVDFRWRNFPDALIRMGGDPTTTSAVEYVGFGRFLWNTVFVCVLGVLGTLLSNSIVAYGFARLKWRGRDSFFALTLATMMVPFPVLMVPLYGVFRELGLIGTLTPLWLPYFFGSAFNIFLMRQFFRSIPEELSEAARIDGCSEWRIFWQIILPLSKPVLATAALFHFLYAWNDFMGPLLFLTRKEDYTLALALQTFQSQHGGVRWHYLMAASAVTILPIIILFVFAQRTFIQGIATTGSKN